MKSIQKLLFIISIITLGLCGCGKKSEVYHLYSVKSYDGASDIPANELFDGGREQILKLYEDGTCEGFILGLNINDNFRWGYSSDNTKIYLAEQVSDLKLARADDTAVFDIDGEYLITSDPGKFDKNFLSYNGVDPIVLKHD